MMNQSKLLTKLNPRYVRVFKSLFWLRTEFYASKIGEKQLISNTGRSKTVSSTQS